MSEIDEPTIFAELDQHYIPTIHNIDVKHPRLMVLFSGPPGSGKSTVAKSIEAKFKGIRLENDAIRTLLVTNYPDFNFEQRGELTYKYSEHLYEALLAQAKNGLWIIDSSVDRRYEYFYGFARKHQFATALIAMDIPEATHRVWITSGGNRSFSSLENYLQNMPMRRQEQSAFLAAHKPDIILKPGYNIDDVFSLVDSRL